MARNHLYPECEDCINREHDPFQCEDCTDGDNYESEDCGDDLFNPEQRIIWMEREAA